MSKKLNSYVVQVNLTLMTTVDIKADSFEKALEEAKKLAVTDIVSFEGDHCDSEIEVTGIFK